jgi:hypothetical protein
MQDGMLSFNAQNNAVMFAVKKRITKTIRRSITFEMEDLQEESFGYACISSKNHVRSAACFWALTRSIKRR